MCACSMNGEKAMAPHSSTLVWKIPWTKEPGRLQSMGSLGHDWVTSLSLFTFMLWRRKWQPTPVFLPGESQGVGEPGGLPSMGSHRVGHDWSDAAAAAAAVWTRKWWLHPKTHLLSFFFFSAALCLHWRLWLSLLVASGGYCLVVVLRRLIAVAEHSFQVCGLQ